MRSLRLEFSKLRRKHVMLVVFLLVGTAIGWLGMDAHQEGHSSATGWDSLFYAAPIMNSVLLSLCASIVASRVADVDHEADAWKQLLCLQRTGSLLAAKLVCAILVMGCALVLEMTGICALGHFMGFPDMPSTPTWSSFFATQLAACLFIVATIGAVALRWESQFVAIACGLAFSLTGLFSSFLPTPLQRLVPSGYFTLLSTTRIEWSGASSAPIFHNAMFPWGDFALLASFTIVACALAYTGFSRREN